PYTPLFRSLKQFSQGVRQQFGQVNKRIEDVRDEANAGTAAALAAGTLPQSYLPGRSMFGAGVGTYEGESALAIGVSNLSDNGRWMLNLSVTADTQDNFGAAASVGMYW